MDLARIDEAAAMFALTGRASILWSCDALGKGLAKQGSAKQGADRLVQVIVGELLQLLVAVLDRPGYSADPHFPTQPQGKMVIPGEGLFYEYYSATDGSINLVKFLMGSGQVLMGTHWDAMDGEAGQIMSQVVREFFARFITEPMRAATQPLVDAVATMFMKWGGNQFVNGVVGGGGGGGGGGGKQTQPHKILAGIPGNYWYWKSYDEFANHVKGGQDTRVDLGLFAGFKTKVTPRQWQLIFHAADQVTALHLGKPRHLEITFGETLELHSFPFDRQLLNVRFGRDIPPPTFSLPPKLQLAQSGEYSSFFSYKIADSIVCNEEWSFLPPISIERAGSAPHFAIRLERRLDRTLFTVILPEFVIVGLGGSVLGFEIEDVEQRLNILMMLLLTSVALSQVSVGTHQKVPYSTTLETYMGVGIVMLALAMVEALLVNSDTFHSAIEQYEVTFYSVLGALWVALHGFVFLSPSVKAFADCVRPSWVSLAKMEADKEASYETRHASGTDSRVVV